MTRRGRMIINMAAAWAPQQAGRQHGYSTAKGGTIRASPRALRHELAGAQTSASTPRGRGIIDTDIMTATMGAFPQAHRIAEAR